MTIGEKIKYLRNKLNITQSSLANKANIHPVSIRKYETNKMIPQQTQIEKLAKALNTSSFALIDSYDNLKCISLGDLYSIIILLYKFGLMDFYIDNESKNIEIKIDNKISQLFDLKKYESDTIKIISQSALSISVGEKLKKSSSYDKFLEWIERNKELNNFKNSLINPASKSSIETINMFQEKIEILELDLQQSTELLNEL